MASQLTLVHGLACWLVWLVRCKAIVKVLKGDQIQIKMISITFFIASLVRLLVPHSHIDPVCVGDIIKKIYPLQRVVTTMRIHLNQYPKRYNVHFVAGVFDALLVEYYISMVDLDEPLTPSHLLTGRRILSLPDHLYVQARYVYTACTKSPCLSLAFYKTGCC